MINKKTNFVLYKSINLSDSSVLSFITNSSIEILDNNFFEFNNNKLYEYISIYEENHDIHKFPINPINISPKSYYLIKANSKNDVTICLELICILYSKSNIESIITIPFNHLREVLAINNSQSIRFMIKVKGKGSFLINDIQIYQYTSDSYDLSGSTNYIPTSQLRSLSDLTIACIFDSFTYECINPICKLCEITPANWFEQFKKYKPHIFMVESAWEGSNSLWAGILWSNNKDKTKILREIILWCNENKIPTIFWNKEDPISYEKFLPITKFFDYIFTTDINCIEKYKSFLNHNKVFTLMFAASPKIHNPKKNNIKRSEKSCFAGTYYKLKFPKRCNELNIIMRAAIKSVGLDIYDRKYNLNQYQYRYPEEFKDYIIGSKSPNNLDVVNKGYKININVNSVSNSPTMFSRRVFESIASGTPILSNVSLGIKKVFNDLVFMGEKEEEFIKEFLLLNSNQDYYDKKVIKGIRLVMSEHTYENRLIYMLNKIGIDIQTKEIKLGVIVTIDKRVDIYSAINMYNKQVYEYKNLIVLCMEDQCLYEVINTEIPSYTRYHFNDDIVISDFFTKYDFIGVFNLNNFYGKYYLVDLVNATKYVNANFIGKNTYDDRYFEFVDTLYLDRCILLIDLL